MIRLKGSIPLFFYYLMQNNNFILILFFFFSFLLLLSALLVISVKNSIYSILFLILSFIMASGLLILLECEFIALIFIVIYVGAISVLFLFVIIMLDVKLKNSKKDILKYFPIGSFFGFVFLAEILSIIFDNFKTNPYSTSFLFNWNVNWFDKIDSITDIEAIGQVLYTYYVIQFLVAGFILLIAVIGSVVLTINYKDLNLKKKKQDIFRQVSR